MATNDDMNMYNSIYTGKQIDAGLSIIYQEKNGIKSIPSNVFFATNENGEANPISTNTIINTNSLEDKLQNYVTLDSGQTITGAKTFKAGASFYQSDDSNLSMNINGRGVTVVNSGSQGMGSLSLDWHSIQISTPSGRGQLVFGFNSSETTTIAFPPTSGTVALLSDIPSLPTDYVTLNTEQTIEGPKTFRSSVAVQNSDGSKKLSLSYQSIQIGSSEFTFPQNGGILALKDDIPSFPTNYVTSNTEQTINGLKIFVGGLNIQGNNLNIAPDGNLVFNTSNNKKITFVLPPTLSENITVTLPVSTKDMEDIGKGGSGSTTLQLSTTDYTNTDVIWQESADNVDVEMGKYYFNITLGSGSTVVSVRTTSNYSLSENSVTALGTNQETWPEIKANNRVIINPNGTKTVRVYSNAKIAGRTQVAYIQQS